MTKRFVLPLLLAIAGLAAAVAITASTASAWSWQSLPNGYSTIVDTGDASCAGDEVTVNGNLIGCTADSGFQGALDAYINSTICSVNPSAGGSQCQPTTTTAPTTTVVTTSGPAAGGSTTTAATTTTASPGGTSGGSGGTTTTAPTTTSATTTASTTTTAAGPPAASFTTTEVGLSVGFKDTSTSPTSTVSTISWQFGDGGTAVGANVSHVYTSPGTFVVVEIVTDANGLANQATVSMSLSPFNGAHAFAEGRNGQLSAAASSAFARPVSVFCVTSWGPVKPETGRQGLSIVGSKQANVAEAVCRALHTRQGSVPLALLVLGHEAAHALGVRPERAADCYSLKQMPRLEKALRIRDAGARAAAAAIVKSRWGEGCHAA